MAKSGDVSSTKTPESAVRAERNRFVSFAFAAADVLLEVDDSGAVRFATGAVHEVFSDGAEALVGKPVTILLDEKDRRVIQPLLSRLSTRVRVQPFTVTLSHKRQKALLGALRTESGGGLNSLTLTRIVDPAIAAPADAARDKASGALGQEDFSDLACKLVEGGGVGAGGALTFLDLGGLEAFEQRLDDQAVDGFFAQIGAYLRTHSVGGDTVGRLGNDRFGVVHGADVDGAEMRDYVRKLSVENDPTGAGLDVSHQSVDLDAEGLNESDIANILVYTIKSYADSERGEFTIQNLSQGFQSLAADLTGKALSLKKAVANDAFDIVYQPIVGLTDGRIHHYEVLTRFADGGSPFETLQLAENVGLICDFDVAVCRRVAQVIQKDVAAGKPLDYAVNLSGRSIQEARVIEALRKAVEPLGPHRKHFMVEVTESFKIDNLEQANRYIQAMRADGIRVCLDDFGAGEASFSFIQALAVDFVKVDGAYIQNMIESGRDMAILSAMVTLCRQLPVGTIAEREETKEQADRLRELGIGYGQGWYFGKPAKVPEKIAEEIYDSAHEFIQPPQRIKGHRSGGK